MSEQIQEAEKTEEKPAPKGLNFALDYGPILVFFLAYNFGGSEDSLTQGAMVGTAAFMIAIIISVIVSKWKLDRISPTLWVTAILVLGFGALTLAFNDFKFIQHKATAVWGLFAAVLLGGWMMKKALLKFMFEQAFEGVDEAGWLKLSFRWGLLFLVLAGLNEVMIIVLSESSYVTVKTFGVFPIIFLFTMTQIPMLMRHGLKLSDEEDSSKQKGD